MNSQNDALHPNYNIICELVEEGSNVLDLGCGDGTLLKMLSEKKHTYGKGIEISQENVIKCINKGLSVIQGNIDEGLEDFKGQNIDYIILNQTLQSVHKPDFVIEEMLATGKKAIVSFPNFGYWRIRFYLLFKGKMPKSKMLPFEWFDTPNIHLLTVKDFFDFCEKRNISISKTILIRKGRPIKSKFKRCFADIFAEEVVFIISK